MEQKDIPDQQQKPRRATQQNVTCSECQKEFVIPHYLIKRIVNLTKCKHCYKMKSVNNSKSTVEFEIPTADLPGWKQISQSKWKGDCEDCGKMCELPFSPGKGKDSPKCQGCFKNVAIQGYRFKTQLKLYIDGLNIMFKLFNIPNKLLLSWNDQLKEGLQSIDRFVKAALKSNVLIEVFIDHSIGTKETYLKNKSRRERDFIAGCKDSLAIMPGIGWIMGDRFKENSIPVHYSSVDCDDTIASFAHAHNAAILSADKDFFRYTFNDQDHPFQLYSTFEVVQGYLCLNTHQGSRNEATTGREILQPIPLTFHEYPCFMLPGDWELLPAEVTLYRRGTSTCLLQDFPSPHLVVRPLRQALYSLLEKAVVREQFPTWANGEIVWIDEDVHADSTWEKYLSDINGAIKSLFSHQVQPAHQPEQRWKNYLLSQKMVVAEIITWASAATAKSLLDTHLKEL